MQPEPIQEFVIQSEAHFDVDLPPEPIQEVVLQSEADSVPTQPILDLVVQTEPHVAVEEVQQVKEVLGRAVGRPSGYGKKRKSINLLCAVQAEKEIKASGKKEKKPSCKKRQRK